MESIDEVLEVLEQSTAGLDPPPPTDFPVFALDINVVHSGVTGRGEDATLHLLGVMEPIKWGPELFETPSSCELQLGRPPNTSTRAWLFVHEHFPRDVAQMCARLFQHTQLLTHTSVRNLNILNILAARAQNTAFASHFMLNAPIQHPERIEHTSCGWVSLTLVRALNLRVGGQALGHVLLDTDTPAAFVDVWTEQPQVLIMWLREKFPDVIFGGTPEGVVVACRPGVGCACRIRIEPPDIMRIQPDFAQCVFDGTALAATPRCLLALRTNTSIHHPHSMYVWASLDAGLEVLGEFRLRGKPTVNTDPDTSKKIWNMLTQYGCVDVSTTAATDSKYFTARQPHPPSQWGYTFQYVEAQAFLRTPTEIQPGHALYLRVSRLYVDARVGKYLHIRREDSREVRALDALLEHLNASYGNYTRTESIVVRVEETPVHALTGGSLTYVPVGCSISGMVWWHPACTRNDGTVYFSLKPWVHPAHLDVEY